MASTDYTRYLERLRAKDSKVLLGSLCWYTVAESVRVKHRDLVNALTSVMLDGFDPPEPQDKHVFRRVCTAHQRKHVETDDADVFENYLIRDVSHSDGIVVKHIVVERVNGKGRKLSYKPTVSLEFNACDQGNGPQAQITSLVSPPNRQAMNLADLIWKDFKRERGTINAYGIREMLRKIVLSTGATVVRPTGGVYFVMEKHRDTLNALVELARLVNGVTFHPVPLINDADQQAMLRDAIENETRSTIEATLDEIDKLMSGPEITAERYQNMVMSMNQVKARTGEYAVLLDDALAGCDLLVKSYDAKMRKLFLHVDD